LDSKEVSKRPEAEADCNQYNEESEDQEKETGETEQVSVRVWDRTKIIDLGRSYIWPETKI
jgi:hypothetical protein